MDAVDMNRDTTIARNGAEAYVYNLGGSGRIVMDKLTKCRTTIRELRRENEALRQQLGGK